MVAPQSAPAVRPVTSRSVAELVTAELRRSILNGALAPGQSFSLREIAGRRPQNLDDLAEVPGIGPQKLEKYGSAVLIILAQHDGG